MSDRMPNNGGSEPDLVRLYLDEIGSYALLSAAEEVALAKRIEAGLYASALLSGAVQATGRRPLLDPRDLALVVEDGRQAKERMVRANLRLVVAVVRRHNCHRLPLLDAIQEGNLGLIRAVEKFDYTKGFKFSTYATWWVRQALYRGAAEQCRTIRLPVHVVEEVNKVFAVERNLTTTLGHELTVDEIAAESGKTAQEVTELHRIAQRVISLDVPLGDDGVTLPLGRLVTDVDQPLVSDVVEHEALAVDVRACVAALPPREARVISMRYGLLTGQSSTLQEVAEELRVSRERIRQMEVRALRLLRQSSSPSLLPWLRDAARRAGGPRDRRIRLGGARGVAPPRSPARLSAPEHRVAAGAGVGVTRDLTGVVDGEGHGDPTTG